MSENSRTESHSQNKKTAQTKSENITEAENKIQEMSENNTNKTRKQEK